MPSFTDDKSLDDSGPVFDADDPTGDPVQRISPSSPRAPAKAPDATHTMRKPSRVTISSTADVSVIEAKELTPAASDGNFGFDVPKTTASELDDGILFDEGYSTATEVLRLAVGFSDPDGDSVTPADPLQHVEAPVEVRKWRTGGGERPPAPPETGPAPALATPPPPPSMAVGTRVDHAQGPSIGGVAPRVAGSELDVDELRRTLEEAEKLLRTVKHQASALDLDLVAPGARGMNAQVAAALHRLSEALAMLRK